MNFCNDCNSYISIAETENGIINLCKNCGWNEPFNLNTISTKFYKNEVISSNHSNLKYYKYDPAIPRTTKIKCPNNKCDSYQNELLQNSIFFTDSKSNKLTYVCTLCDTEWSYNGND